MSTPVQAMTEITDLFLAYWGTRPVALPNRAFTAPTDDTVFAEVYFEQTDSGQASLANVQNKRKYTDDGVVLIELHFPLGVGIAAPYEEAEAVRDLFRGKRTASDVWFRNVRLIEHSDKHGNPCRYKDRFQVDVAFEFTYDGIH